MPRKMWTEVEFSEWMSQCGLSSKQAGVILGVTDMTVIRNRNGRTAVKDDVARRAQAYLETSRTTIGSDAELLDSTAAVSDVADLTAAFGHAVVTGMTSAVLRGWTSANLAFYRQLRQPERRPVPEEWNGLRLEWLPTAPLDLIDEVEYRNDQNGRSYRIASIERTLVDIVILADKGLVAQSDLEEAWMGAFRLSEQQPDRDRLLRLAARFGADASVTKLMDSAG